MLKIGEFEENFFSSIVSIIFVCLLQINKKYCAINFTMFFFNRSFSIAISKKMNVQIAHHYNRYCKKLRSDTRNLR